MRFALDPDMTDIAVTLPPGKVKEDQFVREGGDVSRGGRRGACRWRRPPASPLVLVADSQGCPPTPACAIPPRARKSRSRCRRRARDQGPLVDAYPRKKNWFN
jgi:hypothetical protein